MPLDFSYLNQFQRPQPQVDIAETFNKAKDAQLVRKANEADFQYKRALLQDQEAKTRLQVDQAQAAANQAAEDAQDQQHLGGIYQQVYSTPNQTPDQVEAAVLNAAAAKLRPRNFLKLQSHLASVAKDRAAVAKDALPTIQDRNARLANLADQAANLNDEELAAAWPELAKQAKDIDPDVQIPAQAPDRNTLKLWGAHFQTQAQWAKGLQDAQDLRKKTSDANVAVGTEGSKIAQAASEATKAANEAITSKPNEHGLTPAQVQQGQQAAATLEETRKWHDEQRKIDLQNLGVSQARLGLERQKVQGSLGALSDAQKEIAKKIANGDMTVQQLSRMPDKEALIAGALEINPDWSSNTAATKKAFTDPSSKQSQNLGTIARIVGHIGRFEKNSKELGLSPSMLTGINLTGTAAATANDAHAIAAELEKLVSGGVATVGQTKAWTEALKSSREGIRQAAIDEISQLIGSQFEGMNQSYKAGTGADLPLEQFTTPEARDWLKRNGINVTGGKSSGGMVRMVSPDGKEEMDVPEDQVRHYEQKGAKRK